MGFFHIGSKKKKQKVSVQLLDDGETVTSEFKRTEPAQSILDYVLEVMNIKERDYFGLRFQDHNKHRYWVDLSQPISHMAKQFKFTVPDTLMLRLRFRFYPHDPHLLKEEITRYQLFVQLQRDLLHGRLYCPQPTAAHLAALILQSQLGDYSPEKHGKNYAGHYKLLLKQTPQVEEKIEQLHQEMSGKLTPAQAELEFLETACEQETYGFDPYTVKDSKDPNTSVFLSANHDGILVYKGNIKIHAIPWDQFEKADFAGHYVKITPKEDYIAPTPVLEIDGAENNKENKPSPKKEKKSRGIRYECPSHLFAKHLWNHILSQQAFFTEEAASKLKPKFSKPKIPLLGRGSSFKFPSKRVLREIEATIAEEPAREEIQFSRYPLPKQEPRVETAWIKKSTKTNEQTPNGVNGVNGHIPTAVKEGAEEIVKTIRETEQKVVEKTASLKKPSYEMAKEILSKTESLDEPTEEARRDSQDTTSVSLHASDAASAGFSGVSSGPTNSTATITAQTPTTSREDRQTLAQNTTAFVNNNNDELKKVLETIGEPFMTSTPTDPAMEVRFRGQTETTPLTNGIVKTNGNALKSSEVKLVKVRSGPDRFLVLFCTFFGFAFLILCIIVFFETHRQASWDKRWLPNIGREASPDWVAQTPVLAKVRDEYYEPARDAVVSTYSHYFNK